MARGGEEFPLLYPGCGGDIRLVAFIINPVPIRTALKHLGELPAPPPVSLTRRPPIDMGELVEDPTRPPVRHRKVRSVFAL